MLKVKIEIDGNSKPSGFEITIKMNGSIEAKYIPNLVKYFLTGIASHGTDAKYAVALGVNEFIDSVLGDK